MRAQNLFYNAVLNPVIRALLRSPLHRIASRNIGLLCYRGRKSGRRFETPLSYVRDGNVVRFLSSHDTRWWLNFRDDATTVEVEMSGSRHPGTARLFEGDSDALRDGVRQFLTALPRDAMIYGIKLDAERKPREADIEAVGRHVILVEVDLDSSAA
jgi:hypothetical protein